MYTLMKKTLIGISVSAMLLTSSLTTASVTYYKSVGANGEVRYTQFPPENTEDFEKITMRSDGRQDDVGKMAGKTSTEKKPKKKLTPAELQAKAVEERIKKQKADEKVRRCQALRNNLTNLNIGGKIYEKKNGTKHYLSDAEIEKKRQIIKQAIGQYCDGQSI